VSLDPFNPDEVRAFVMRHLVESLTKSKDPGLDEIYTALLSGATLHLLTTSVGSLGDLDSEDSDSLLHLFEVKMGRRRVRFNITEKDEGTP
jgi:hypothetical protein